ncbi:aspartate dehydrogenase [Thalassococcus lentus]|uniref:L-aspartate dehydrogenase n=1 Tax=Thalassococcus lentus TaxID=1210524 RepID=A0ABT4XP14_9RHOB|nr:aspartate dehydrogenase [Thalassococcus lentus]MDA7423647.1 aspartate dehydrogenase [Thalassococcus lentus]
MHIGLIGFGSIGRELHKRLAEDPINTVTALTRSPIPEAPRGLAQVQSLDALLAAQPDVVVECAGHSAVQTYAVDVLQSGTALMLASQGALADQELLSALQSAADNAGTQLIFPSGAIGGLDLLRACSADGPVDVMYQGIKPPKAWAGSRAEESVSLNDLRQPHVFFQGTGREATLAFPKNANVVAALALAGAGFDRLQVELIADPEATGNTHRYSVTSPVCKFEINIENAPSAGNARTSMTTVLSILMDIRAFAAQCSKRRDSE